MSPSGLTLNPSAHQGLVQSRDEAVRYVLRNPQDACGLNLLGLLYEQERLLGPAERALEQSMLLLAEEGSSSSPYLIQVMTNYARLLRYKTRNTCLFILIMITFAVPLESIQSH